MTNLERRLRLLEGGTVFDANGRDPKLIGFARWLCETSSLPFDPNTIARGVSGEEVIRKFLQTISNHGHGLPTRACACARCV
jgi:hypothetical protein